MASAVHRGGLRASYFGCKSRKVGCLNVFYLRFSTLLLAQCLNSHSEIAVPNETDFIIPLAFVFDRIRDPETGKKVLTNLITRSTGYKTGIGEYLEKELVAKLIKNCDYHPARILCSLYGGIASVLGKKVAGDKSPNDLAFLRILIKVGGIDDRNMKIIHIVRDVRDVMVSLKKVGWGGDLDSYFPRTWSNSNLFMNKLYKDNSRNYFCIKYEDMVSDPVTVFKGVARFLKVDYEQGMLDFKNFHPRYKELPHHKKLYTPISTNNIGVYKNDISRKLLADYERQAREALNWFRYPMGEDKPYSRVLKEAIMNRILRKDQGAKNDI